MQEILQKHRKNIRAELHVNLPEQRLCPPAQLATRTTTSNTVYSTQIAARFALALRAPVRSRALRGCCALCAGPSGSRSVASTSWFCVFCVFCVINYLLNLLNLREIMKTTQTTYSILILYYNNLFQLFKLFSFIVCEICIRV